MHIELISYEREMQDAQAPDRILYNQISSQCGVRSQMQFPGIEVGKQIMKDDKYSTLNGEKFRIKVQLDENFNANALFTSGNTCSLHESVSETLEFSLLQGNKLNAEQTLVKAAPFRFSPNITGYSLQEKKRSFVTIFKGMSDQNIKNEGNLSRIKQREEIILFSPEVCHISKTSVFSNNMDKNYSVDKFLNSMECVEESRPSQINNLSVNDKFKTKHLQDKISHKKPEIIHFNYFDPGLNEILCILVAFLFPLCIFEFSVPRRRTIISSNTHVRDAMVPLSDFEIELRLSESAENNDDITGNRNLFEDRTKVNKENLCRPKILQQKQKVQQIQKMNLEPVFNLQPEATEGKQEEKEHDEFHPGNKTFFSDNRPETQTSDFYGMCRKPSFVQKSDEGRSRKRGKDIKRRKVRKHGSEQVIPTAFRENSTEGFGRVDDSCSQDIKQDARSEFSGEIVRHPTHLERPVKGRASVDSELNSTPSQMSERIFIQQGDFRFQCIADKNSNFTIKFNTEEKSGSRDKPKYLKYKLKVKNNPANESRT